MNRLQWKLFFVFLPGMFVCFWLSERFWWSAALALLCFAGLLLSTVGVMAVRVLRDVVTRWRGVPTVGRVIHAHQSGYSNNVPTWEIEVELPEGTRASLLVNRFGPFVPDEPIQLLVDPRSPKHVVLPPRPSPDF